MASTTLRLGRLLALSTLAAAFAASGCIGQAAVHAAPRQRGAAAWHIVETANLRILNYGVTPVDRRTAERCESLRGELARRWLGDQSVAGEPSAAWSPKCDIVLHANEKAYLQAVGAGGQSTVASSLVDWRQGRIVARRIDVRSSVADWQTQALGHELTHVVLADRFGQQALPRWLDEGIAMLADPADKQQRHARDLRQALVAGSHFRLAELIVLADYPATHRWGAFYGQSASLVRYLVEQSDAEQFLKFVELSLANGYEHGLQTVYAFGVDDLERRWHAHVRNVGTKTAGTSPAATRILPVSLSAVAR